MKKLKYYLEHFMDSRNGMDQCSVVAFIASMVLYIICMFVKSSVLFAISFIFLVYSLFRILSKNRDQRYKENQFFVTFFELIPLNFKQRKTHRIFMCKKCCKKIRVPKGKGKIEITCPLCKNKMIHRT